VRRFAILQDLAVGQDGLVRLASKRWTRRDIAKKGHPDALQTPTKKV
jgi:hypothetical protein